MYSGSRHNIGFLVLDAFASMEAFPPFRKKREVDVSENDVDGEPVVLVKPRTYMNQSGRALRDFLSMHPVGKEILQGAEAPGTAGETGRQVDKESLPDCLLVVHDDLDLPLGRIRFRSGSSSGGHRGVASVISELSSDSFSRLKVGIGRREGADPAEYVLEPLGGAEKKALDNLAVQAARTLSTWIREGVEAGANRYNSAKLEA